MKERGFSTRELQGVSFLRTLGFLAECWCTRGLKIRTALAASSLLPLQSSRLVPKTCGLVLVLVLAVGFAGCKSSGKTPAASLQSPPKPLAKPLEAPPAEIKTVAGWNVTDFAGHGEVRAKDDQIILEMGAMLTGIHRTNDLPKMNYEVSLEAMKVSGGDFFCGLTFPVGESFCSFIVGGWGGGVVGLSSIDGEDAANNETTKIMGFDKGHWYKIRLRVTPTKIEAWIDAEKVVDFETTGRKISLRAGDIELSKPFGLATYQTTAALRNIQVRPL